MTSKFSTSKIVSDHIKTLRNYSNGKRNLADYLINFVLPFFLALFFIVFHRNLNQGIVGIIITAFSIFTGLLLNIMFMMYSLLLQDSKSESRRGDRTKLLKETYSNIQFSVLVSIIAIIIMLIYIFLPSEFLIDVVLSFLIYWLVFLFVTTLLIVMKRTHTLFSDQFG